MKATKKIISVLLALIMVMGMPSAVFAADSYTITITNAKADHTYEAYQIFTGDLYERTDADGETVYGLTNIVWGSGVTAAGKDALGTAKTNAKALKTTSQAEAFAAAVSPYLANPAATAKGTTELSVTEPGYYLIKDQDNTVPKGDSYTEYILKVVGNVEVEAKDGTTQVIKQVKDVNDSKGTASDWQGSADYDIGDKVPFKLTATLASNVTAYDTYKVVFNDTLAAGLSYDGNLTVKIDGEDVTDDFTVTASGQNLTVSCSDVKALDAGNGSVITVEYDAELNTNAVIGEAGNLNTVYLTYSNDPNHSAAGDSNKTGDTPEDYAIVFTYKAVLDKVDGEGQPLSGAQFTLEKWIADADSKDGGSWSAISTQAETKVMDEDGQTVKSYTFEFKGLDDGTYRLTESTTPDGYNTIDDVIFEINATHNIDVAGAGHVTVLSGDVTEGDLTFTATASTGTLASTVINEDGSLLPSTGGMGTTMLYIGGAVLIIGAAIMLFARRRSEEEN